MFLLYFSVIIHYNIIGGFMEKTYKILTYGCQMNVHESEKIAGLLEREGYTCAENDFADVVVLNT